MSLIVLQFEDVFLFNFFSDSSCDNEWRVLTQHMVDSGYDLNQVAHSAAGVASRPLQFEPNKHLGLLSELKHLYTALTRARYVCTRMRATPFDNPHAKVPRDYF